MKSTKLPKFPANLPDDAEVRDFALDDETYARVIMEIKRTRDAGGVDHLELTAQAYEMDKSGNFKTAPIGYPSRSATTTHTVNLSAVGKTINIDDSWVESPRSYDPVTGELASASDVPELGTHYGQELWVVSKQRVMVWTEGFADIVARTKVEDLLNVLKTSDVRSGFAFRNRRNKE
jgi:hypothetical protein